MDFTTFLNTIQDLAPADWIFLCLCVVEIYLAGILFFRTLKQLSGIAEIWLFYCLGIGAAAVPLSLILPNTRFFQNPILPSFLSQGLWFNAYNGVTSFFGGWFQKV
jgi:hypothetical protein